MKICFLIRALIYGGAERQLVLLAKGLQRRGHEVVVAIFYSGGPLESELREAGLQIQPLHKKGRWDLLRFFFRFITFLRQMRPDILHSYMPGANLVAVAVKPFVPMIKVVWGIRSSTTDFSQADWFSGLDFKIGRWVARFADIVIANSQAGRAAYVASGYPAAKMKTIRNGIDTERFGPDPEARRRLRGEWHIADHERAIGIVGRLDPVKDHPVFLEAASILAKQRENLRFVCVGGGVQEYEEQLNVIANNMGLESCLSWIGPRSDMSAVYNALDMVVSSSSSEALSNVVGEAMATGVPCIVTDVGDSAWLVGDCGEVVPRRHPVALANAIARLLDRPRHDPAWIREAAVDRLSIDRLVTDTEQLLREVCDGSLENAQPLSPARHGESL